MIFSMKLNIRRIILSAAMLFSSLAFSEVKVLTINIAALSPFGDASLRVKSLCKKAKLLKTTDVIFVQEIWLKEHQELLKDCGFPHTLVMDVMPGIEMHRRRGEINSLSIKAVANTLSLLPTDIGFDKGLMILSKHPLTKSSKITFRENGSEEFALADGEFAVAKGAIGAVLDHPIYGELFVATTHMVADYSDHDYKQQREDQLIQLVNWLGDFSNNRPTIIAGDFNASCLKDGDRLNSYLPMGSRSLEFLVGESTYNGQENIIVQESEGYNFNEGVLDHVIAMNGATITNAKIVLKNKIKLDTENSDEYIITQFSDHFGVFSTIQIDP